MDGLREGLSARPHVWDDLGAIVALLQEAEAHDQGGEVMVDRDDIVSEWAMPSLDRNADTVGVWAGTRIVAAAMIRHRSRALATVHPQSRGQGLGTAVRRWTEGRARELGSDLIGQTLFDGNTGAVGHLVAAGYTPRHTAWVLHIDPTHCAARPSPPRGIELRTMRAGEEHPVYEVVETAFAEFPGRQPQSFGDFAATTLDRPGAGHDDVLVAIDGELVCGTACCFSLENELWIDKLAVARSHRRQGLATALLQLAFRTAHERGLGNCGLSTDSRTGALGLYERAGMRIQRQCTHYALDLT